MMDEGRSPSRGSYELYENQKALLSSGEGRGRASPAITPGCPGSPQDNQQMLEEMSRKLTESKVREDNLLQIISELRVAQQSSQMTSSSGNFAADGHYMNAEGASGLPTHESQDEKVKDGRILHLQRQITVLQASVYKAESWASRTTEAMKERDQALDQQMAALTQLSSARQENEALRQEINRFDASCVELQQKLVQSTQDLEVERRHERCQSQVAKLQQELDTTKASLITLRESVSRLSQENKGLKEISLPGSQSSLSSNPACNQELEYLHSVVDALKRTVLDQRNFLVNMNKPPQSVTGPSSSPSRMVNGGRGNSPPAPAMREHQVAPAQVMAQNLGFNSNNGVQLPVTFDPESTSAQVRVPPTQELETQMAGLKISPNSQNGAELFPAGGAKQDVGPSTGSDLQRSLASRRQMSAVLSIEQGKFLVNGGAGEKVKRPIQYQMSAPVRKVSQSEILARRANSDASMPRNKSNSEVITRQNAIVSESKAYPNWMFPSAGVAHIQPDLTQFQTATPTKPPVAGIPGVRYEAEAMMGGGGGSQYALTGSARLPMASAQRFQNPAITTSAQFLTQQQQKQLVYSPVQLENGSVHVVNYDITGGGRVVQAGEAGPSTVAGSTSRAYQDSPTHSAMASTRQNVSAPNPKSPRPVGVAGGMTFEASPFVETSSGMDSPGGQLNADRVCPVCSRSFGVLSMEEFQTHVFECFDDENAPETMRPSGEAATTGERFCPMCNTKFGSNTQQAEYEKHVHGHFGEELPGENFEILQP